MKKNLKKCYRLLDLPFDSTEEDVELRKRAMIKILESETGVKNEKKITFVENASSLILENIKNNGIPNEEDHYFESSNESIIALFVVMVFVCFFCYCCIHFL